MQMNAIRPVVFLAQLAAVLSIHAAPIHDAAFRGDLTAVRQMIAADSLVVYLRDSLGASPLHYAALGGHQGIVDLLIGRNAPVDARDVFGSTPLHYAMRGGPRFPPIEGAFVRIDGLEAIYRPEDTLRPTAELPWNSVILSLTTRRADVDAADAFGATPLHRAAGAGRILLARTLLGLAAYVNARDANERTPLHWAVEAGNAQIVVLLLREQADVNVADKDGRTPLHFAAMYNRNDIAGILIERGAGVDTRDKAGLTARDYAEREGDDAMVNLLQLHSTE
jgi:ankyrin repeat protein